MELIGYHGTDRDNFDSIRSKNFWVSKGDHHWLGKGVYFFLDGVSLCPQEDAKAWANLEAWDNKEKRFQYDRYCVIRAEVTVQSPLDLRDRGMLRAFNLARLKFWERFKKLRQRRVNSKVYDPDIIRFISSGMKIDCVISDMYFRLTKDDRRGQTDSRLPNCTVACIGDPSAICLDGLAIAAEGFVRV